MNAEAELVVADALAYAQRVVRAMSRNPDAEECVGEVTWAALRSYDAERGLTLKQWVCCCIKRAVWDYWRKEARRKLHFASNCSDVWWERAVKHEVHSEEIAPPLDWMYLVEHYIDRVPLDVMAKTRNTTVYQVRLVLERALERLSKRVEEDGKQVD